MPVGLLLLIGVSIVVFRRARLVGRNSLLWVVLLWIITIGVGFVGGIVGGILLEFDSPSMEMTDYDVKEAIKMPTAVGMLIGAVITFWLAGRPVENAAEIDDFPEDGNGHAWPERPSRLGNENSNSASECPTCGASPLSPSERAAGACDPCQTNG